MSEKIPPPIHRPRRKSGVWFPWFRFKDEIYEIRNTAPGRAQSNGDGYIVVRKSDGHTVVDGVFYISEIRDMLARAVSEDWPSLEDTNPPEYVVRHEGH